MARQKGGEEEEEEKDDGSFPSALPRFWSSNLPPPPFPTPLPKCSIPLSAFLPPPSFYCNLPRAQQPRPAPEWSGRLCAAAAASLENDGDAEFRRGAQTTFASTTESNVHFHPLLYCHLFSIYLQRVKCIAAVNKSGGVGFHSPSEVRLHPPVLLSYCSSSHYPLSSTELERPLKCCFLLAPDFRTVTSPPLPSPSLPFPCKPEIK